MTMNSPQDILNELQSLDLPSLYADTLTAKDRLALLKLAKQKLRQAKRNLRDETKYIESRWDGRNRVEALHEQNELLPYTLVDEVLGKIETDIQEVETLTQVNRPLPVPGAYGYVIVGGIEYGGYVISDLQGAIDWQIGH